MDDPILKRAFWAGQKIDDAALFEVAQDGALPRAATPGPVVDAKHAWRLLRLSERITTGEAQQGSDDN